MMLHSFYIVSEVKQLPHICLHYLTTLHDIFLQLHIIYVCLVNGFKTSPNECQTRTDTAAMEAEKKPPNGSFASRGITTERTVRIANHPSIKGDISP